MSLAVYLYFCLQRKESMFDFIKTFNNPPLAGKVVINQQTSFAQMTPHSLKAVITVLQGLAIKENEESKTWFIEIKKVFTEKNLKILYLPFSSLKKIIFNSQFHRIPDPVDFLIGLSFRPDLSKMRVVKRAKRTKKNKLQSVELSGSFNHRRNRPTTAKFSSTGRPGRRKT